MNNQLARPVRPFDAVISPYHITTREPASLVAIQIAESATTLLLAPTQSISSEASIRDVAMRSPVYRAYMRSWEWAMPLFQEGVLGSVDAQSDPVERVREAYQTLHQDPICESLSPFLRTELFEDDATYLRVASADVLKAGPDPAISIPITAGLDRFAADRAMVVARSAPASLVQKTESRLGRVIFRTTIPIVVQGSAERLLLVRALLANQRRQLASAIIDGFETGDPATVREAARTYAAAFDAEREHIAAPPGRDEADEVRLILGEASLVGMTLPVDAVFRASVGAATGSIPPPTGDPAVVRTLLIRSVGGR